MRHCAKRCAKICLADWAPWRISSEMRASHEMRQYLGASQKSCGASHEMRHPGASQQEMRRGMAHLRRCAHFLGDAPMAGASREMRHWEIGNNPDWRKSNFPIDPNEKRG
jgi:hypothetical protein